MKQLKTIGDVKAYIRTLASRGSLYHWDDNPNDIVWNIPVNIPELEKRHAEVWSICNPWKLIEHDKKIAAVYGL